VISVGFTVALASRQKARNHISRRRNFRSTAHVFK
jgi:hypothetical protein